MENEITRRDLDEALQLASLDRDLKELTRIAIPSWYAAPKEHRGVEISQILSSPVIRLFFARHIYLDITIRDAKANGKTKEKLTITDKDLFGACCLAAKNRRIEKLKCILVPVGCRYPLIHKGQIGERGEKKSYAVPVKESTAYSASVGLQFTSGVIEEIPLVLINAHGKEDDNVIEEFKAPAKKEWEKPKVEKEFKWTVSAIFELPNGERIEIPEPGPKWSLDKEKSYSWPSKYVRAKGEFFFKMREHEITYRINHPIGKMIWAEYREQLFKEQARVLSTRHWSREVTPKIVVSTEGPILRKLW